MKKNMKKKRDVIRAGDTWYRRLFRFGLLSYALFVFAGFWPAGTPEVKAAGTESDDLCQVIPGTEVADAVGGTLLETKTSVNGCVYIVGFKSGEPPGRAFVIYRHEPGAFEGLKDAMDGSVGNLKGIGDEAVIGRDRYSGRYWLLAVIHGKVTYQFSGDDVDMTLKVARAALKMDDGQ